MPNDPGAMYRHSPMVTAAFASMPLATTLQRRSMSMPDTIIVISVSCVSAVFYFRLIGSLSDTRILTQNVKGAYILFNFSIVFIASYLYLGGLRKLITRLSPAARKQKKARKQQQVGNVA